MIQFKAERFPRLFRIGIYWYWLSMTIPIAIIVTIFSFNHPNLFTTYTILGQGTNQILAFVAIFLIYLFTKSNIKAGLQRLREKDSYVLTIDEEFVRREIDGLPVRQIRKSEVTYIAKTKGGRLLIKGGVNDSEINIPTSVTHNKQNIGLENELLKIRNFEEERPVDAIEIDDLKTDLPSYIFESIQKVSIGGVTVGAILLGFVHLYFYYHLFNIPIYYYLDASEMIFAFTNIWIECLVVVLYFLIIHRAFSAMKFNFNYSTDTRLKSNLYYTVMVLALLVMVHWVYILTTTFNPKTITGDFPRLNQLFHLQVIGIFFFGFSIGTYLFTLTMFKRVVLATVRLSISLAVAVGIGIIIVENYMSYRLVTNGFPKYQVRLERGSEKTIETSDSFVLIGRTQNYFFFRDLKKGTNTIVPRSSVTNEEIHLIRKGL